MRVTRSLPNLRTIAGDRLRQPRRPTHRSDERHDRGVSVRSASKLHGWLHALQDNLCVLLETLGPAGCRKAYVDEACDGRLRRRSERVRAARRRRDRVGA